MINIISSMLDSIADHLEYIGLIKEAYSVDVLSNTLDAEYSRIEKKLEDAYKNHAPQSQINLLETELSKYINEGDLDVSEEDMTVGIPATSEGYSIDEELRNLYHQYLNAGNKSITPYDRQELIGIMRGALKDGLHGQKLMPGLSDTKILEAAKDAYDRYKELSVRRNNPNRSYRTPGEALRGLGQIRGRLDK